MASEDETVFDENSEEFKKQLELKKILSEESSNF